MDTGRYFLLSLHGKYMNRYPDFAPEIIGLHKKETARGKNYLPGSCQKEQSGFDSRSLFRYNYKAIQQLHSCIFREVIYTMATNKNLRFKTSRRFGMNIYGHPKALKRQPAETRQKKMSEYGLQLTENRKLKRCTTYWKDSSTAIMIKREECPASLVKTCCPCSKQDWTT